MSEEEKANVICFWNAVVIAAALVYFGHSVLFSLLIAFIVLISTLIGYGRRHLFRAGFAMMVIALSVAIGLLPPLEQWVPLLKSAQPMTSWLK